MKKEGKNIRGIILAGGTGSRLMPLTKVTNKHLLPVGRKPMLFHSIEKLTSAGISDILIVTGVDHMGDIVELLGSGKGFDCKFTYKVQDEAGGIAQALGLAEDFICEDKIVVILGDNIFQDELKPFVDSFKKQKNGAKILLKEVSDPHRFGVVEFENKKIIGIEEKPKRPKSKFAVTGIYFYDCNVFNIIKSLKPSHRGELEISDVNSEYLRKKQLEYDILSGWWSDAGTFESLKKANLFLDGEIKI